MWEKKPLKQSHFFSLEFNMFVKPVTYTFRLIYFIKSNWISKITYLD